MFSRSKKHTAKRAVSKPATISVIKPDEKKVEPALDLSKAKITIIKPESGLRVMVKEEIKEED